MYNLVHELFTTEMEVHSIFGRTILKQHTFYLNFRCRILFNHSD